MKQQKNKSNFLPFVIIGVVLIAVVGVVAVGTGLVGAGLWFSTKTTSTSPTDPANRQANTPRRDPASAPPGAALGVNTLGPATAVVTVEEFADYQCGACAIAHPVMKELKSAYAGNRHFRFIFRHYPLALPAHDKAYNAAVATEAAGLQGKFWQFQDLLFRNQSAWTSNPGYLQMWEGYASSIGMDVERFKADMGGSIAKQRVDADLMRGRGLGVSSTPTVYVNGEPVPANISALRVAVDAAIQKGTAGQ